MINIALVGAGKLGSRHLQALGKLDIRASIYVIDPNPEALEVAQARFNEIPTNHNIVLIKFLTSINEIGTKRIEIAIIATTSEYRRGIIERLTELMDVKYLILEKILFQKIEDYHSIQNLLKRKNIKAWVNCPRRMWEVYKNLKNRIHGTKITEVNVVGQNWSLATSSIHFIDLIAYLSDCREYRILNLDFNNEIYPAYSTVTGLRESKYLEFFGSMKGRFSESIYFNFTCLKSMDAPFLISIVTVDKIIQVYEELGKIYIGEQDIEGDWCLIPGTFKIPYQSELTHEIVEKILKEETSSLTSFEESVTLHLPLLESFVQYISEVKNEKIISCPIT